MPLCGGLWASISRLRAAWWSQGGYQTRTTGPRSWPWLWVLAHKNSSEASASPFSADRSAQVGQIAFIRYLGCTLKGLVDYFRSTWLSVGAAAPLNLGAESWRRFFEAFVQLIAGTLSLMIHWLCLGACYANIVLALPDSTQPPGGAVPACLTVASANGTRYASRTPLRTHPSVANIHKFP